MRAVDIIRKQRDGEGLTRSEIEFFIEGVTVGTLPDYQVAALLMAIVLKGMSPEQTAWLTDAMVRSGIRVDLAGIPGFKVDKHSTGGVGDKLSLVLAPLASACGAVVPMMSGRGLGHTGGTLDKLEAIPGFRTSLSLEQFRAMLSNIGCALIGQTAEMAPADRKLYALRDVTSTVESIPLISASIMSKKIAEGIDGLVLDVKCGRGAFMKTQENARALAESLVSIGTLSGVRTQALITAMDAPLGRAVGNSLEVIESIETLKGEGPKDVESLSVELAARMLRLAGVEESAPSAEARVRRAIASGAGLQVFARVVEAQGGDPRVIDDYSRLPSAPARERIRAPRSGFVRGLDAGLIGRASMALGAGRDRVDASIDPGVGITVLARPGDRVAAGDPVIELHHRQTGLDQAVTLTLQALELGDAPLPAAELILDTIE